MSTALAPQQQRVTLAVITGIVCFLSHTYQTKEERFRYLQDAAPASLFDVKPAVLSLPEKARLFQSLPCDGCGEVTAEHLLRLENGKKLCLDCFRAYNRFDV